MGWLPSWSQYSCQEPTLVLMSPSHLERARAHPSCNGGARVLRVTVMGQLCVRRERALPAHASGPTQSLCGVSLPSGGAGEEQILRSEVLSPQLLGSTHHSCHRSSAHAHGPPLSDLPPRRWVPARPPPGWEAAASELTSSGGLLRKRLWVIFLLLGK